MPPSQRTRRALFALLVVALSCAGAAPAVADSGPDAPVETPTPPVETPRVEPTPSGPVENTTDSVPTPDRTATPAVRNRSDDVRTAVGRSADRVDDVESQMRGEWSEPRAQLGPPASENRSTASRTRRDASLPTDPPTGGSRSEASSPSASTETARSGASGCSYCGGVVPTGVVLLGLAGGAGAVSLGATAPQSTLGPSARAVRQWVDRHVPRLLPLVLGEFRDEANPLTHRHRSAVRDVVDERPGVHLGGVVDEVSCSRSTVRHHVRVLEEADELQTAKLLGRRRLFPPDADTDILAALADEGSRRVVRTVATIEPATVGEIVDATDRAYSTVSYHLDRLETAGVVVRERDGRRVTVRLADDAAERLAVDERVAAD